VSDVIFLATIVAFFALCAVYIRACDRIIGPDTEFELGSDADVVEAAKSLEQAA
jgi:hypothetical protein